MPHIHKKFVLQEPNTYQLKLLNSNENHGFGKLKGLLPAKEFLHYGKREFHRSAWTLACDQVAVDNNSVLAFALVRKFVPHSRIRCSLLSLA